jgi:hypothetical protein
VKFSEILKYLFMDCQPQPVAPLASHYDGIRMSHWYVNDLLRRRNLTEHSVGISVHLHISLSGLHRPDGGTDGTAAPKHFAPWQVHFTSTDVILWGRRIIPVRGCFV